MTTDHVVSHHFFRRRARAEALRLNLTGPAFHYTVRQAQRGPYRWYVVVTHPAVARY